MIMKTSQIMIISILSFLFQVQSITSIQLPASFTVVRNIGMPLNPTSFYNYTGCCQNDTYGSTISYTHISLDGFKSTSTLNQLQNTLSPLGLWLNAFSTISGLNPGLAGNTTSAVQSYLLQNYHNYGVSLLLNAFADESPISQSGISASIVAQNLITTVITSQLDGVSLQFNDFQAVAEGTASDWLSQLLTFLRQGLPKKTIVLIIPVTIISRTSILQQSVVSAYVDLFVLKYFGYNQQDYVDYNSIFNNSIYYPQTAFSQLLKSSTVGINLCRTLIAKPPSSKIQGYVDSSVLDSAFGSAFNNFGWFGGYANLDFQTDIKLSFQKTVLQQLRNSCLFSNNCFCI